MAFLIWYNNFCIHTFHVFFFSWVSSPKLLGGRKGVFYTPVCPSKRLAQCNSLGGSHRRFGDSLVLPLSSWERRRQNARAMWNMPIFPCHPYGSPERKITFIFFRSGCRAIEKKLFEFYRGWNSHLEEVPYSPRLGHGLKIAWYF